MNQEYPDVRFPGWEVVRKLGQGSFGGVYEIQRTLPDGRVERGALKKLSVPRNRAEIEEMLSQSFSTESITAYYKDQMSDLVREYSLMQELGSCGNVVTCHDIQYVQQEGGLGWDVYIRMELLRPLKKALGQEYREETVLKLGLDLCNALKTCQKKNIIHRDIKPSNLILTPQNQLFLVDFNAAKAVSPGKGQDTVLIGTAGYAAPVFGEDFDYLTVQGDVPPAAEFAVRIQGDSMEPFLRDGGVAYVNHDPLRSGDAGIFCVDGEMFCKQYYRDPLGMVYLFSLNRKRADADILLPPESGRSLVCLGRVMLHTMPLPGKDEA